MANTYKVLVGLVNNFESLSKLVVLLAQTHVSDQETIDSVTSEAQTVKQQLADAISQAQQNETKIQEAETILSQDVQEEDLATRLTNAVDELITVAKNALPPQNSDVEVAETPVNVEVDRTTAVNVAEPRTSA